MAFLGITYSLDRDENFDKFVDSLEIPEDKKQLLLSFKPSQSIRKEGDAYVLNTTSPGGGSKDLKFQDGVEFDEEVAPGVVAKSTFKVEGNVVTQVQNLGDLVLTYKREYSNDQLVVVLSSSKWDGVARRYYKAA
ncbi:unnamed protein product [Danaus chrysippus]|uniref:(African queen) hypothetical protein n=1 Tax=Danaus chrysippus TaxID=151541 RepID=A0A8J2QBU9_9NEOP|nr:unnamed protein product [Danaus chrysippus]